ncbi:MAG: hypothetical protein JWR21_3269 [Herminiimonas sp.]|nr:hypothetical protein [Herminiimonas sp.]
MRRVSEPPQIGHIGKGGVMYGRVISFAFSERLRQPVPYEVTTLRKASLSRSFFCTLELIALLPVESHESTR